LARSGRATVALHHGATRLQYRPRGSLHGLRGSQPSLQPLCHPTRALRYWIRGSHRGTRGLYCPTHGSGHRTHVSQCRTHGSHRRTHGPHYGTLRSCDGTRGSRLRTRGSHRWTHGSDDGIVGSYEATRGGDVSRGRFRVASERAGGGKGGSSVSRVDERFLTRLGCSSPWRARSGFPRFQPLFFSPASG
jgi:hypothetical protein